LEFSDEHPRLVAQHPRLVAQHPHLVAQHPRLVAQHPCLVAQHPRLVAQHPIFPQPRPQGLLLNDFQNGENRRGVGPGDEVAMTGYS